MNNTMNQNDKYFTISLVLDNTLMVLSAVICYSIFCMGEFIYPFYIFYTFIK